MERDKAASIAMELSLFAGLCLADKFGLPTGEPIGRGEPTGTGIKLASSLAMKSSITSGALVLGIIKPIGVRYG